jgi:uncharacterized protein (DUF608 family)
LMEMSHLLWHIMALCLILLFYRENTLMNMINILKESLNILVDVVKMVMISKSVHHA